MSTLPGLLPVRRRPSTPPFGVLGAGLAVALAVCPFIGTCGGGGAGGGGERQAPSGAPNVVLVSIDSLRFDHLSCYGYSKETSPVIDRLAAEGVRFDQAVSTTSWTLPAHAALFTGLYDSSHGLVDNNLRLSEDHVTLAEVLRQNGWRTAGFFGGPYLHPTFGLGQGFESYQSCMTTLPDTLEEQAVRDQSRSKQAKSHADVTGPRTLEEVRKWLGASLPSGASQPFFLFLHLWDVHYDFLPPRQYVDLFDPGYDGPLTGKDFMTDPLITPKMSVRDFEHLLALYDAEIRFADEILGQILAELERREAAENTLIVITADHGEEFFEHKGKGHQRTLYDEVVRIPLVFHWKGRFGAKDGKPRTVAQQVRIIDIMPTVLTLCGIDRRPAMQGSDLTPLLLGGELPEEPALCELLVDGRQARALRTSTLKAVYADPNKPGAGFFLDADPKELAPVGAEVPRVAEGLARLERERESAAAARGAGAEATRVDPALLDQLRQLGYVGGGEKR